MLCEWCGCSTALNYLEWTFGYLEGLVAAFVQVVQGSSSLHAVEWRWAGRYIIEMKAWLKLKRWENLGGCLRHKRGFPPFLTWCCGAPGVRCPAASSPAARCCGGARPWVYPGSRCAGALRCHPVGTKHHQNTRSTAVTSPAEWLTILARFVVNSREVIIIYNTLLD